VRKRPAGSDERRICLLQPPPSNRGMKLFYEGKKRKEDAILSKCRLWRTRRFAREDNSNHF
jgi:hypothetical protein